MVSSYALLLVLGKTVRRDCGISWYLYLYFRPTANTLIVRRLIPLFAECTCIRGFFIFVLFQCDRIRPCHLLRNIFVDRSGGIFRGCCAHDNQPHCHSHRVNKWNQLWFAFDDSTNGTYLTFIFLWHYMAWVLIRRPLVTRALLMNTPNICLHG